VLSVRVTSSSLRASTSLPATFDLFAIVKLIVDHKAQFRSLAEPWADTSTATGRLMIAVLGGLADAQADGAAEARGAWAPIERDLIRTRTSEGRERAKTRGVRLGRKPRTTGLQGVGGHRKLNDIPVYFWGTDGCLVVPPALVGLSLMPVVFGCAGPDLSAKNM
jgi:hypothetical protein